MIINLLSLLSQEGRVSRARGKKLHLAQWGPRATRGLTKHVYVYRLAPLHVASQRIPCWPLKRGPSYEGISVVTRPLRHHRDAN